MLARSLFERVSRASEVLELDLSGNPTYQELDRGQPGYQGLLGFYCFHPLSALLGKREHADAIRDVTGCAG